MNYFKTADIRIQTDSQGMRLVTHRYQGTLIDWEYFDSRKEARQAGVEELRDRKELAE